MLATLRMDPTRIGEVAVRMRRARCRRVVVVGVMAIRCSQRRAWDDLPRHAVIEPPAPSVADGIRGEIPPGGAPAWSPRINDRTSEVAPCLRILCKSIRLACHSFLLSLAQRREAEFIDRNARGGVVTRELLAEGARDTSAGGTSSPAAPNSVSSPGACSRTPSPRCFRCDLSLMLTPATTNIGRADRI
jgi:hypothetical protein